MEFSEKLKMGLYNIHIVRQEVFTEIIKWLSLLEKLFDIHVFIHLMEAASLSWKAFVGMARI